MATRPPAWALPTRINEAYSASDQLTAMTTTDQLLGITFNNNPTNFNAGLTNTERTASGSTTYQNGPEGLANQTGSNATISFTHDPSGTLISERVGGQSYYYLFDGRGSVVGLVNASGAKVNSYGYDPYGGARATSEQVANPNRHAGGYLDATPGSTISEPATTTQASGGGASLIRLVRASGMPTPVTTRPIS